MNEKNIPSPEAVYQIICSALDSQDWHYSKQEKDMAIVLGLRGDAGPVNFLIEVDAQRQLICLMSPIEFKMSEEMRMDGALATLVANYGMVDGCFEYDLSDGSISFRMAAAYANSLIGKELILYMIACTKAMIDKYMPQFMAINKGMLEIEDFIAKEKE
jgi:hypothetical protein